MKGKGGIIYQILKSLDGIEAYRIKKTKNWRAAEQAFHSRCTKEVYEKVALAFGNW